MEEIDLLLQTHVDLIALSSYFATACTHTIFYNTLINAISDTFEFTKNFIDKCLCKLIYRQRATLLRKIEYFVSKLTY